jgi:predicted nucleic acid-binding Zn ribbon protein
MTSSGTRKPQALAGLLPRITSEQGWQQQLDSHRLFLKWDTLVDPATSAHARPLKIVANVLWLEVANSAWMQQLQFQKIQLLETLNATLRLSRLADIRFTLTDSSKQEEPEKAGVSFVQPNPAARDAFYNQIAAIENEAVRDALMSLWYQSHSCRRD